MTIKRRHFLVGFGASAITACGSSNAFARAGMVNASSEGLVPNRTEDQGKTLQEILNKASAQRLPIFIEPGNYHITNIRLPKFVKLHGLRGTTVFRYAGGKHFIFGEGNEYLDLTGLTFDGANRPQADYANSCVHIDRTKRVLIEDCEILNARNVGLTMFRSSGSISGNTITHAHGDCGVLATNNQRMKITDNLVSDCDNGGIIVSRWEQGPDNTIITGNRVERIAAKKGGTGQWGNGINTYQADNILIASNHVSECTLSAIRSNSCDNVQINSNTCLRSGETGIYSEFAFQGANISDNLVDGGAVGISVANFNEGGRLSSVTGNVVRNIGEEIPYENPGEFYGLGISVEADTTVSGNVIDSVSRFGLKLGWGPYLRNVIANGNVIREAGNGIYVSVVEGIGQVIISDNIMSSIKGHGIAGYRWHDRVTKELSDRNGVHLNAISLSGNRLDN